ncbi:helix-turn-helix transcriptional regulator [Leucobacter sp. cx-328]|uniref:TetR/AcrR family transcriptional regulator n=1 Tax=unclassified Leucobacter TaxID=2621730 RepID=UPI00165D7936|nr:MULTISPECIES: helix-turn-helix domain-containing protein [unclassified Leucobacter]MBC9943716.1 helix-turn-helix transcriptional regulator [Leucobacter sp. cx-328]
MTDDAGTPLAAKPTAASAPSETPAAATAPLRGRAREARDNDRILLQAAREVFAQRGWQAPMSAVAEHAGIGIASIYRRFPSKDDLVLRLRSLALCEVIEVARASLTGVVATEPLTPGLAKAVEAHQGVSAVARFLRLHITMATGPLTVGSWRQALTSPEIEQNTGELRSALDALIAHDAEAGYVPQNFTAADLMLGVVHLRPNLPTSIERATEIHTRHLELYLLGLAATAATPSLVSGFGATWNEWLSFHTVEDSA